MEIIRTCAALQAFCRAAVNSGGSLALVPTMGALHAGHMSLMQRAVEENDVVVASVFVNPTQFNDQGDLQAYPRTEEADFELLEGAGVHAVFAPSVDEMYPRGAVAGHVFDLGSVAEVMEGEHRPGHFQGVAQVVSLLFGMVRPHRAYFGEKDFQQIAVIRRMARTEGFGDIEVVPCPIKREDDGLAMSSRNVRLTPGQRAVAPGIYGALAASVPYSATHTPGQTAAMVIEAVNALPECEVEYFSIVDADTLQPVKDWSQAVHVQGCITVYCGPVRLIDNICYR